MSGIENTANQLGRAQAGTQIRETAETLHKKGKITDAELDELRNPSANSNDVDIGKAVVDKLMKETSFDSLKLMSQVTRMNQNVLELRLAEQTAGTGQK